eukprot:1102399-Pleurochrysis_carterae.AAC.1
MMHTLPPSRRSRRFEPTGVIEFTKAAFFARVTGLTHRKSMRMTACTLCRSNSSVFSSELHAFASSF